MKSFFQFVGGVAISASKVIYKEAPTVRNVLYKGASIGLNGAYYGISSGVNMIQKNPLLDFHNISQEQNKQIYLAPKRNFFEDEYEFLLSQNDKQQFQNNKQQIQKNEKLLPSMEGGSKELEASKKVGFSENTKEEAEHKVCKKLLSKDDRMPYLIEFIEIERERKVEYDELKKIKNQYFKNPIYLTQTEQRVLKEIESYLEAKNDVGRISFGKKKDKYRSVDLNDQKYQALKTIEKRELAEKSLKNKIAQVSKVLGLEGMKKLLDYVDQKILSNYERKSSSEDMKYDLNLSKGRANPYSDGADSEGLYHDRQNEKSEQANLYSLEVELQQAVDVLKAGESL